MKRISDRKQSAGVLFRQVSQVGLIVLLTLAARSTLADHYVVPSGSMEPTVQIGTRILVAKAAYRLRIPFTTRTVLKWNTPHPGDVVVLESPEDGITLLKRVAAGPGDLIEVRQGRIYLDGSPAPIFLEGDGLTEDLAGKRHPVSLDFGGGMDFGPLVIPEGHLLVLGDNRGNSRDGRMFGLVSIDLVLGKALGAYWSGGELTWNPL